MGTKQEIKRIKETSRAFRQKIKQIAKKENKIEDKRYENFCKRKELEKLEQEKQTKLFNVLQQQEEENTL